MRGIIRKILSESDWDWVSSGGLVPLSDYVSQNNINRLENLVGLTIQLSPKSEYYIEQIESDFGDRGNPIGIKGKITGEDTFDEELPLQIMWENGVRNCYSVFDLDVIVD